MSNVSAPGARATERPLSAEPAAVRLPVLMVERFVPEWAVHQTLSGGFDRRFSRSTLRLSHLL